MADAAREFSDFGAVVGDAETTDGLSEHVRDADLLVIEATFLERDAAMASNYGHLTAARAAELAADAGVSNSSSRTSRDATTSKKSWPKPRRYSPGRVSRRISIA